MGYLDRQRLQKAEAAAQSLRLAMAGVVPIAKQIEPKPLYVRRDLKNGAELVAWAKEQGIPEPIAARALHTTITYSKTPVDWLAMGNHYADEIQVNEGGPRVLARFGADKNILVLAFSCADMEWRNREMREAGASFDWPEYTPHVTLSLGLPEDFDIEAIKPYSGKLVFGPEIFEPIDDDWAESVPTEKWNANQPRNRMGQWSSGGGFGTFGGAKLKAPQLGIDPVAPHLYAKDPQQAGFMKPLTQAEIEGTDPYLGNPYGFTNQNPKQPTPVGDNDNPEQTAVFVAGVDPGPGLNGIAFKPWDGPEGGDWSKVGGTGSFDEPDYPAAKGKRLGAGVIVQEPDGRVWTVSPLNNFGGYDETLPKGGIEDGLDLRQTAIKEAWEESGLRIELTGYLGDFERTTSVARYYTAKRTGGDPTDFHWETRATNLVPMEDLGQALHHQADKPIVAALNGEPESVVKLGLAFADLCELLGDDVFKAKKAWSTQPRVPSGFPTGGQWSKGSYGGGSWGGMYAAQGVPLELQKYGGTGPQAEGLNKRISAMEAAANEGVLNADAVKLLAEGQPKQTYAKAAWQSAHEAKAYIDAKAGNAAAKQAKATAKTPASAPPLGSADDPLKLSAMTKTAPKPGGSALGAVYTDADGTKWLVKSYKTQEQAFNEVAASKLYNVLGVATPEMKLIDTGSDYHGGIGVASRFIDDVKPFDENNPAHLKTAQKDLAAHAVLANWDAVGLTYDNLMVRPDGSMVMIDPGGSLMFRAQGTLKGTAFSNKVGEMDSLRDPKINPSAAKVFGPMTASQMIDSMQTATIMGLDGGKLKPAITEAIRSSFPKGDPLVEGLTAKMQARFTDLATTKTQYEADFGTTLNTKIENTGTEKAVPSHPDPVVNGLIASSVTGTDLDDYTKVWSVDANAAKAGFSGKATEWYKGKVDELMTAAAAGDVAKVQSLHYNPSASTKSKPNYGHYTKAYNAALKVAQGNAAKATIKTSTGGDGAMLTGGSKVTGAAIQQAKELTANDKVVTDGSYQSQQAMAAVATPEIPKADAATIANPPPALPMKPKLTTPSNKNIALNAQADAMESIAKKGGPGAAAQIAGIAATIKGSNTYSVSTKNYAANLIASLGGQTAIDSLPKAAKKTALDSGIEMGAKIKTENGITTKTTYKTVVFDPDTVPKPPDFNSFGGSGQPLSGKPEVNADNNAKVNAIYKAGLENDVVKVSKTDVSSSLDPNFTNKHVQGYKSHVIDYLTGYQKEIGTTKEVTEFVGFEGNSTSAATAAANIGKAYKSKSVWEPGVQKVAGYAVAGDVGKDVAKVLYDAIPPVYIKPNTAMAAKLKDQTYDTPAAARAAMRAHVWGKSDAGWAQMNEALFTQKPGDKMYDIAIKNAADLETGITLMPTGLVVGRKISYGSFAEWQSAQGKILTIPGLSSTSINPAVWSGSVGLKIKFSEGAKAAYVGHTTGTKKTPSDQIGREFEHEVILPHNIKLIVANVFKGTAKDDYFGNHMTGNTIVEVIAVLNDEPYP